MNTKIVEAEALAVGIRDGLTHDVGVKVILCPPFVSLSAVCEIVNGSGISVGAQNLHHGAGGAYTGEVSAAMLVGVCSYVIVGHSERRGLFGETDEVVNLKLKAALEAGIAPILCIGESLKQRKDGSAEAVVASQLHAGLEGVALSDGVVVAYEPVWAIGTGQSATPEAAQDMMAHIRRALAAICGEDTASAVPLLYGGSVNPDNIAGYISQPDINGALVGGASLDAASFLGIVGVAGRGG